jgi:4-hydroxybenzoate polyprenyltransferase|tara:strand:- start:625 stop:1491 length:867 start_codon:yes stop_codon:yes gene_type:complete
MKQINLFIELTRLKKPIGYLLLFWPCAWGLTAAFDFSKNVNIYFFYLLLFLAGAILMRSAGCIVNDIFDKDFDRKVERTKNRPIAAGKIPIKDALIYTLILCFLALLVLINFNWLTVVLALCSMPLAFTYPLMKRYTYWPQLFLGITFNYGLILGWVCIKNGLDLAPLIFYMGAIFWTLGYDTIYGYQDIKDDEIIGLKSTSIKFKNNPKLFIFICYSIFLTCLLILGLLMNYSYVFFISLMITFYQLFFFQIRYLVTNNPQDCLKKFKSNNLLGLIVFINLLIGKFF